MGLCQQLVCPKRELQKVGVGNNIISSKTEPALFAFILRDNLVIKAEAETAAETSRLRSFFLVALPFGIAWQFFQREVEFLIAKLKILLIHINLK